MLGCALTFLILAVGAGLLAWSETSGAAGDVAWLALLAAFVVTLAETSRRVLDGVDKTGGERR